VRYSFIVAHVDEWPVTIQCRVLRSDNVRFLCMEETAERPSASAG